jgi:excisionase family DNA binding protein
MDATTKPNWMTPDEVAEDLQVCRRTADRLIKRGTVPSIKIGDQTRVPREGYEKALLLQTLNPKRPDWMTDQLVDRLWKMLDDRIDGRVAALQQRTSMNQAA